MTTSQEKYVNQMDLAVINMAREVIFAKAEVINISSKPNN